MVLPTFVEQALAGEPLTVYGDGKQKRCFCSVSDVVMALVKLPTVPAAIGKVINVGERRGLIEELAQRVIQLCESAAQIKYVPYDRAYGPGFDDMARRVPDLTRAATLLGWKPKQSLNDIIHQINDEMRRR